LQSGARTTVVDVGKVKKYSQIEDLTDRPKLLHQNVIQARKVVSLEGSDDRISDGDRAGLDGGRRGSERAAKLRAGRL
jgi:hypothetical protein